MKTNQSSPGADLQAIREIMERSSRFLSLSGLSGVSAGLSALFGAALARFLILGQADVSYGQYLGSPGSLTSGTTLYLALDAILVFALAALGAVYFSRRKAQKAHQPFWTHTTRRLLLHLLIPLVTGGIFAIILILRSHTDLVAPVMLIFYGLSLVNAGKFTFGEIHYLGLTEIVLGFLACLFIHNGLLFWTLGFGLMHIVYGTVMWYRYEREK